MAETTTWNGSTWGTNRGTVFAEITRDGNHIEGRLSLVEPELGQLGARLIGEWSGNKIDAKLEQFTANYSVAITLPQDGSLHGSFQPDENVIHGEWKTDVGTAGKFVLVKILGQLPTQPTAPTGKVTA